MQRNKNFIAIYIMLCLSLCISSVQGQTISAPVIDTPLTTSKTYFYNGEIIVPYNNGQVNITNGAEIKILSTSEVTLLPGFTASVDSGCGELVAAIKNCPDLILDTTINNLTCKGSADGVITVFASGGSSPYLYDWSPVKSSSPTIKNLSAGMYNLTVTDQSNCSLSKSFLISEPDSVIISTIAGNSNCNDSNGTAIVSASGGAGNYNYYWHPYGGVDSIAQDLISGKYMVSVIDSRGCARSTYVYINDLDGPDVSVTNIVEPTCNGRSDGRASISVINGTPPYSYNWMDFNNEDSINLNLRAGTYFVEITDSNNCSTIETVIIPEPTPISLSVTTNPSSCGDSTGQATIVATGGVGNYTYLWTSERTDSVANNLPAGFDTVIVADQNGCEAKSVVLIQNSDSIMIDFINYSDLTCFGSNDGNVEVMVTGGSPPYSYTLLPEQAVGSSISNLSAGKHDLLVTDDVGCRSWKSFQINDPSPIDITLYYINPSTDSASDGVIWNLVTGGTPPYSYRWSHTDIDHFRIENIPVGEYSIEVTDLNGCLAGGGDDDQVPSTVFVRGRPNSCVRATPANYCTPIPVSQCSNSVLCYKDIVADFGADPTGISNSQCAFEAASDFFNARHGNGTLNIPPGTYKVGVQFPSSLNPLLPYGKTGSDVLCFRDCHNLTIQGKIVSGLASKIRFDDCLEYGTFDRATGQRIIIENTNGLPYSYLSSPGNFLVAYECSNLTIRNLDIDGNSDNLIYGGHFNDGIQITASGIILNSCRSINNIENVNVHHFGQDGLALYDNLSNPSTLFNTNVNLRILNSKFNWNGRIGFYWAGGKLVTAINSEFNNNAIARFGSKAADGLDYEYFGGIPMENGSFTNCEFMYNAAYGIEVYGSNKNLAVNQTFTGCDFASSVGTFSATPNGQNFFFEACNFYGPVTHAYNDVVCQLCVHTRNIEFKSCFFYEDFNGFSFNQTPVDNCPTLLNWGNKPWLVDFSTGAAGAIFYHCDFESNKDMQLINIEGGVALNNFIEMQGCQLTNHGINDDELGRIKNVNAANRSNILRNVHPWHHIYEAGGQTTQIQQVVNLNLVLSCVPKYPLPPYPNRVEDAYTFCDLCVVCPQPQPCTTICPACTLYAPATCLVSPGCNPCPKFRDDDRLVEDKEVNLFPNPASNEFIIEGVFKEEEICIFDMFGKRIYFKLAESNTEKIKLEAVTSGVYIVSVGKRSRIKLVKN